MNNKNGLEVTQPIEDLDIPNIDEASIDYFQLEIQIKTKVLKLLSDLNDKKLNKMFNDGESIKNINRYLFDTHKQLLIIDGEDVSLLKYTEEIRDYYKRYLKKYFKGMDIQSPKVQLIMREDNTQFQSGYPLVIDGNIIFDERQFLFNMYYKKDSLTKEYPKLSKQLGLNKKTKVPFLVESMLLSIHGIGMKEKLSLILKSSTRHKFQNFFKLFIADMLGDFEDLTNQDYPYTYLISRSNSTKYSLYGNLLNFLIENTDETEQNILLKKDLDDQVAVEAAIVNLIDRMINCSI